MSCPKSAHEQRPEMADFNRRQFGENGKAPALS